MKKNWFKRMPKSIFAIAFLIIVWVLITMVLKLTTSTFIPSPVDLGKAFYKMRASLIPGILSSLSIAMGGFAVGLFAGLFMGLLMAYSKSFLDSVGPIMEFTRPVPIFALIPLFMIWFGLGITPQVLLVALGVMAIIGIQTYEAIRNMPVVYIRAALNLGASKKQIFATVVSPYIFPHLVGAIRVAAAAAWGLDVAAEFMGVQVGLGYNMIVQQMYLNTPGIIAIVIVYSILAILLDQLIARFERRVTHWTERSKLSFEDM